jgi:hypothetical protein
MSRERGMGSVVSRTFPYRCSHAIIPTRPSQKPSRTTIPLRARPYDHQHTTLFSYDSFHDHSHTSLRIRLPSNDSPQTTFSNGPVGRGGRPFQRDHSHTTIRLRYPHNTIPIRPFPYDHSHTTIPIRRSPYGHPHMATLIHDHSHTTILTRPFSHDHSHTTILTRPLSHDDHLFTHHPRTLLRQAIRRRWISRKAEAKAD